MKERLSIPHTPGVIVGKLDHDTISRFVMTGHPRTVGALLNPHHAENPIFQKVQITRLTVNGDEPSRSIKK